jgi:iron complex outermembrane recepter protein
MTKFGYALLACSAAIIVPCSTQAQSPQQPAEEATPDIVITGTRVATGNNSPVPVTVIQTETLINLRPTSLTESINVLPVFSGSRGQISNPSATGGVGGGNGNASQLNLRNIGGTRNLVLLDGRRVPPTSITNTSMPTSSRNC